MSSEFTKFYQKNRTERLALLTERGFLTASDQEYLLESPSLPESVADSLIENQLTQFPLPMGVALNFIVDQQEVVVPMVVEEPSVIAASSNGAKMARKHGGFQTTITERSLVGQIIMQDLTDVPLSAKIIQERKMELIAFSKGLHPSIVKRGGGVTEIDTRIIYNDLNQPEFLTIHLIVDVQDAMGANIVNTILEGTSQLIKEWLGGDCLMSILSNYNDHSLVTATCLIDPADLTTTNRSGLEVAQRIVTASRYAKLDPYRAATHNKGIMNGIDSVLIATGNDPRAIEAGAHAYTTRNGRYEGMTTWEMTASGLLAGELTLPLPIGTAGGAINVLPLAKINLELLKVKKATDLASIVCAVGLAQNFSALRALVSEGIQKGHMGLHAKSLAIHVGAEGAEIELLAEALKAAPLMNSSIATELLGDIRS